ncbi:MAG: hypothetical protein WDO13_01310 [Verrucomicrobiota bacterium]
MQSGTFWMHSLYGLQEQQLDAAPLVIRSPEQDAVAGTQYTVMLSDFSFSSPTPDSQHATQRSQRDQPVEDEDGPREGEGGRHHRHGRRQAWRGHGRGHRPEDAPGAAVGRPRRSGVVSGEATGPAPDTDVKYDALLADRRTIDNPEVLAVKPGETVLLRLIAASAATNFFVDTGALDATIVATDGENVQPLKGNFFQLGIAQRLDLLVTIPAGGGAFPILALGEGTRQRAGVILSTAGAKAPSLGLESPHLAGGLDNTQELHLAAKAPLPDKPVQRWLPLRARRHPDALCVDDQRLELSQPAQPGREGGPAGPTLHHQREPDAAPDAPPRPHLRGERDRRAEGHRRRARYGAGAAEVDHQGALRREQPRHMGLPLPHRLPPGHRHVHGDQVRWRRYELLAAGPGDPGAQASAEPQPRARDLDRGDARPLHCRAVGLADGDWPQKGKRH